MKAIIAMIFFSFTCVDAYFNTLDSTVFTHKYANRDVYADNEDPPDCGCGCGGKNKKKSTLA